MCGIAGIVNKTKRPFDFSTFCILGIENDSRGGDSCGIFIDGEYEYGVSKEKLFSNYFQDSKLIYETKLSTIALLHCRKASIGKISKETAQPVIIKDTLGNIKFVVMHNGTIYNYKELAEKYIPKIDITDMTDSQVMAHIFYYAGYDVLSEYNGGAVFCIVDYRGYAPRTLLWKGASRKGEFSKTEEEERPLYYCIDPLKRELVFSSLWLPILAMRKDCTLYTPRENTLIEFIGTGMKIVQEYPRTECIQTKKTSKNDWYSGGYDWSKYTSPYLSIDFDKNLYSLASKPLHGKVFINKYGRVLEENDKDIVYEAYFYNGVLLKNKECFECLTTMQEKHKLTTDDFYKKYWNVVRFLSYDGIFNNGGFYYEATSPDGSKLYTGSLDPITTNTSLVINNGKRGMSIYSSRNHDDTIKKFNKKTQGFINFKEVLKKCKSLKK